jgi:hypothetical protein
MRVVRAVWHPDARTYHLPGKRRRCCMLDLIFVFGGVGLFVLAAAYVIGCERL